MTQKCSVLSRISIAKLVIRITESGDVLSGAEGLSAVEGLSAAEV